MTRRALFVFLVSMFVGGFVICGGGKAGAQQPMTDQQKLDYAAANCICAKCPSYIKEAAAAGEKVGYCLLGKSKLITQKNGCICMTCPVEKKLGFDKGYYCLFGSAAEMASMPAPGQPPAQPPAQPAAPGGK